MHGHNHDSVTSLWAVAYNLGGLGLSKNKISHTSQTAGVFLACETGYMRQNVIQIFIVVSGQSARYIISRFRQLVQAAIRLHSAGGSTERRRRVVLLYEILQTVMSVFLLRPHRVTT